MTENKRKKKKQEVSLPVMLITCAISALLIFLGNRFCNYTSESTGSEKLYYAKVESITDVQTETTYDSSGTVNVVFQAKLKSGEYKGQSFSMQQTIDTAVLPVPDQVSPGDKILVMKEDIDSYDLWIYAGVYRLDILIILVAAFFALILLIGKQKGIATLASLLITVAAIFAVFIPAILTGKNIYLFTILITLLIILSSLIILNGINKKTLCAVIGNAGGILISGVLCYFVNSAMNITGIVDEDYLFLTMIDGVPIDLRAVVWGGILIGSLGAVMDVAMSIASAMQELSVEMKRKSFHRMVRSGMNIGRDAIGTMTNTLILAYVGSSLAVVLLFTSYNRDLMMLFNMEMIAVEIAQAIVGSIGILLAVPITVFFSAWIFNAQ